MTLRFSKEDLLSFERASGDRNPLHSNPQYARETPFGEVVVFGVQVLLASLALIFKQKNIFLSSLEVKFKKPVLLNQDYSVKCNFETETHFSASISRLGLVCCEFSGLFAIRTNPDPLLPPGQSRLRDQSNSFSPQIDTAPCDFFYQLQDDPANNLFLKSILAVLPGAQVTALLWSSYFVGMEYPGTQALFSELHCQFQSDHFDFSRPIRVTREWDDRISLARITAVFENFVLIEASAFKRPEARKLNVAEISEGLVEGNAFSGKTILVTGGSRGFGASLALAFASQGARLFINYAASEERARHVLQLSRQWGADCQLLKFNAGDGTEWSSATRALGTSQGYPDILFLNAAPFIPQRAFTEQTTEDWLDFVQLSLKSVVAPCQHLLPVLRPDSCVVLISSIYVAKPVKFFSHYIAAKAAAEQLIKSLALEFKSLRFIIVRPPKMDTDQTASILPSRSESPLAIAVKLLNHPVWSSSERVVEIDLA
ncbi:MAG: fabG 2 [Verrucomicrobiales bacterium]|nr:fabG 2 [Verrucomicrobiales bacterium]